MEETVPLDKIVGVFIKIRDARSARKKAWETEDRKLKEQMDVLEGHLLQSLRTIGVESAKTQHGTVYTTLDVTPQAQDWDKFYAWVAENMAFEALERRIKKTFITTYMEDNDGELPPGVTVFRQHQVNVRRNNKE